VNASPASKNIAIRTALLTGLLIAGTHLAAAQAGPTIAGSVSNQTTGQAAAGDDVILLRQDMQEEARTRTDEQGRFVLPTGSSKGPYLVRVRHQGINYDHPFTAGQTAPLPVFDTAASVAGVSGSTGIIQMEADLTTLHVRELYAIENHSTPPRTRQSAGNFEIHLPQQAVVDSASVAGPRAQAAVVPAQMVRKGLYRIDYPLLPGETRYMITYHLPYRGTVSFRPGIGYGISKFAVMVPEAMVFKASRRGSFRAARNAENGPVVNGAQIQVASQPIIGDAPEFQISGTGILPPVAELTRPSRPPAMAAAPLPAAPQNLQKPTDARTAPDVSKRNGAGTWLLPASIAALLIAGLSWVGWRRARPGRNEKEAQLLDGLKEELFRLESDRARGAISEDQYETAKQALSKSIERAMKARATETATE
jgi:hypothetical protein